MDPAKHRLNGSHSLVSMINGCKSIKQIKQIHAQIITSVHLLNPTFFLSRLLFFFATSPSASLPYSSAIFRRIEGPNLFTYNCMIRAHSRDARTSRDCLSLYKRMLEHGVRPDHLTFSFLLKSCARRLDIFTGQSVHGHVLKLGNDRNIYVENVMISLYSECRVLGHALKVFDEMRERDIVSWNSVVVGCLRCGALDLALEFFRVMRERNVITWNSMITGFVQGGRAKEALDLFHEMQISSDDRVVPDGVTLASVIAACASLGALDQGKWVHGYLRRSRLVFDVVIGTALVDMYGKCGSIERAIEVFSEMPKKDVLAWTAMIKVFADHGLVEEAFRVFGEMEVQGTQPNQVTFIALLCACAHAGFVGKGWWVFNLMKTVYFIEPQAQHYACMVDLLGRAALFNEAEELIKSMAVKPDVYIWGALLGGCRMHGNVVLGEKVAEYLTELEPQNHAFYMVLSDIYAKAHRFDGMRRVRALMRERGIKKTAPGSSMIEIDGVVHEFSIKGSSDVIMDEIEWIFSGINSVLREEGHVNNFEMSFAME